MFLIPHPLAANRHSGESRNPGIKTGCPRLTHCRGRLIRSGMTSDTSLLCGGVVHSGHIFPLISLGWFFRTDLGYEIIK
jgi:hypothetical protein